MRIAVGLAAVAVVAGMILAGGVTAPAARAATGERTATPRKRPPLAAKPASVPVGVRSHYAELVNAATGANLWSRSSVTKRPMGSVTKVMTAYVVLTTRGLNLKRVITVPSGVVAYDERFDASTAGLRPGEKLTTLQLLYAMLLPSGCDAAYTLASAYGPGLSGFVARMNATARTLGLAKTHFTDPSGLPNPGPYSTYSTAHDLIALGLDAMKNKTFATIVATRGYKVASERHPSRAHLEEPRPAAREGARRDRHQDRVHERGGAVPAVRGATGEQDPDRGGARLVGDQLAQPGRRGLRRGDHAGLGFQPLRRIRL